MNCHKENWAGRCCCTCKYQRPISGHPWNKNIPQFRGSIMDAVAWGCTVPDMPTIVLFETEHGLCEMWTKRRDHNAD